jgi:hypothetical protein
MKSCPLSGGPFHPSAAGFDLASGPQPAVRADFTPRRSLEMLEWSGQSWPQRTLRGTSVPLCEARRP